MTILGDKKLLEEHCGHGFLLAYLRNLPEMNYLYNDYCFNYGSRGRGNGKVSTSALAGSNIWLADTNECVLIYQIDKGRGPLAIIIYANDSLKSKFLSTKVLEIIITHNLPYLAPDST